MISDNLIGFSELDKKQLIKMKCNQMSIYITTHIVGKHY